MKELMKEYHEAMSRYMYYSMKLSRSNRLTQEDLAYILEKMSEWEAAVDSVQAKIKLFKKNAEDKL